MKNVARYISGYANSDVNAKAREKSNANTNLCVNPLCFIGKNLKNRYRTRSKTGISIKLSSEYFGISIIAMNKTMKEDVQSLTLLLLVSMSGKTDARMTNGNTKIG